MRGRWTAPAVAAILVAGCIWGCGRTGAEQEAGTAAREEAAVPAADDAAVAAQPARIPVPEATGSQAVEATAQVDVEGKLGCGHCNYHVKDSCCLAMQATDGTVYLLEAEERQDELMDARLDQPAVKVTGRMAEVDGHKVIYTDTVEMR